VVLYGCTYMHQPHACVKHLQLLPDRILFWNQLTESARN
jgi:hypothetical protein